ncbi:MAG: hypothetical protein RIT45_4101 [Pseudomonadota bacterium]|jgi:hypothetical protein
MTLHAARCVGPLRRFAGVLVLALGVLGCVRPQPLDAPDLDPAARAASARAKLLQTPGASHLELAWLCLLHGYGCRALPTHAEAAVEAAPTMALAQLTRALGLQGTQDVRRRAAAWLDLATWAGGAEVGADADPAARALGPFALRMALRLTAIDAAAVREALAASPQALTLGLQGADARERHAVRSGLDGVLPRSAWPDALDDGVAGPLRVRVHRDALHPRAWRGLALLTRSSVDRLDPNGWHRLPPRGDRHFELPPAPASVRAIEVRVPARPGGVSLLVQSARPFRLVRAGAGELGPTLPAGTHVLPLPAAVTETVWLAISATGGLHGVDLAAVSPDPSVTASRVAPARDWQTRAVRRVVALGIVASEDPAAGQAWRVRGALPALLGLLRHRSASEAPTALLDRLLDHRSAHVDARVARAGRARDDGQAALGRALLAPLVAALEQDRGADGPLARRIDLLMELGWADLADGLGDRAASWAERAMSRQAGDCGALSAALELSMMTLERAVVRRLLASAGNCPELELRLADASLAVGDLVAAERRLRALAGRPATAQAAQERLATVRETLARPPGKETPRDARWREVQALRLAGRDAEAAAALNRMLLAPGVDEEQRRRALALGATRPWAGLTVDGAAWVREVGAADAAGAGMVWLLDQEIVVLLPGGGAIRRLHQIVRVERAEVADQVGEVQVPEGAEVELVRTITPDGQFLGPADTPDKETISLRGVVPGAFVEQISVQFVGADDPATGATRLPTFLFGSFDGPVLRAEVLVLAPEGIRPMLERGAAAPQVRASRHTARVGGAAWQLLAMRARDLARLRGEPRANRPERLLATVRVSHGTTVQDLAEQLEERLAAHLERRDPVLESWLAQARAAGRDATRWQALVARLNRRIEDGGSAGMPGAPDVTASNRKGDRAALLWHLAQRVGVDACLWRVSPWTREPVGAAADPDDYGLAAVALPLLGADGKPREVVYDAGIDGGLPDVLRPGLRRRPALRLGCALGLRERRFVTGDLGAASDRREIRVQVRWTADGAVVARGDETLTGVLAVVVRNLLVSGDEDTRAAVLQQLTSASFPGMEARWRDAGGKPGWDGLGSDLEPLRLRWEVHGKADPMRERALRLGVVPYRLARIYATLAERKLPLRVGHTLDVDVRYTIDAGGPVRAVAAVDVEPVPGAPHVALQRRVQAGQVGIVLEQRLRVDMGVVAPADYPTWAERLRRIDDAERLRVERVPPALAPRS